MISTSRKIFRGTLVFLICALVGGSYLYQRHKIAALGRPDIADGIPDTDMTEMAVPGPLPKPSPSAWLDARTRRFTSLFKNFSCDVLVVPVQVEGFGFDRPNREIMSGDLAFAVSANGHCVTNPYLVDLALGEGLRRRNPDDVLALAKAIKATTVITTFAGQGGNSWMRITMQVTHLDPLNPPRSLKPDIAHSITNFEFSAEHPPFLSFEEHLPLILNLVGLKDEPRQAAIGGSMPDRLPASPDVFIHAEHADAIAEAANLIFLGMLAPAPESRAAERLFTKAWLYLQPLGDDNPAVRMLRVRILYHLHERPYALTLIEPSKDPRAAGLRALLNGNLPTARAALAYAQDPWERFFLGLEVHDLEKIYLRSGKASAQQVLDSFAASAWHDAVAARLGDRDTWAGSDTIPFKKLLDSVYPILGFTAPEAAFGNAVVSSQVGAGNQLLALRHVHRLIEQEPGSYCCASFSVSPMSFDLLDVIDGRIEASLIRQTDFLQSNQGNSQAALALLQSYDSELSGNPAQEELRARIYWKQILDGQLQDRDKRIAEMHAAAHASIAWEQGQSPASRLALWYLEQPPDNPAIQPMRAFSHDYPLRPYWNEETKGAEQRLAFSSDSAEPLDQLLRDDPDNRNRYLAELEFRFMGNPEATNLGLDNLAEANKNPEFLRQEIAKDPDNWRLYAGLADILLKSGSFAEIPNALFSYPGFQDAVPENTVELSNHAYNWGNQLFWLGAFDAARPLLQRSAGYNNGSGASISSSVRLALLDKQFGAAAAADLEDARHYNNLGDYGEFLRLMFASGRDHNAWAIFDQLQSHFRSPQVLGAATVGNRKAGMPDPDLRTWLVAHATTANVTGNSDDIARYALFELLTDRLVSADIAQFMTKLAGPADVKLHQDGHIYPSKPQSRSEVYLGPSRFGASRHPGIKSEADIPHRYVLIADAFSQFRAGHYDLAAGAFDQLAAYYDIESSETSFVLPYFAFAEAKTGDKLNLEKYLSSYTGDNISFNVLLARAVFAALGGRPGQSDELLDKAYLKWPYSYRDGDLDTSYVYLDVCASLYETTHDERYRTHALKLARALRVIEPTDAYSYALLAYLDDNESERLEALAIATYLDPRSAWASKAPTALRAQAQEWLKSHHPFELVAIPTNI